MAEAGNREDLVIATKYSLSMNPSPGFKVDVGTDAEGKPKHYYPANGVGNQRKSLRRALDESLARLQTSYVDVYCTWSLLVFAATLSDFRATAFFLF